MQAEMHATKRYGTAGYKQAGNVATLMRDVGAKELLDYGSGSRLSLKAGLDDLGATGFAYRPYEPAIPEYAGEPEPSQFVACIDVLEHIEPECLDAVLDDLQRVTQGVGYFTVHCGPAGKHLPDGRNAHLIQEGPEWWLPKIMARFTLKIFQDSENGFAVVVTRK